MTAPKRLRGMPPSAREMQLVRLVARGMTNQEIGAELHLSTDSVKSRVRRLFVVLGVSSREEAIVAGVACGALRLVRARERVAA